MIELKNVSYTYPHTVQTALHHLSLFLPKGQVHNGHRPFRCREDHPVPCRVRYPRTTNTAGKKRAVTINGRNVADYTGLSELAQKIGIVFDDPEAQMIFTTVEEEILSALEHRGLEAGVIEDTSCLDHGGHLPFGRQRPFPA